MFGAILKATNISFQKGMTFYRSIYAKKVMKLGEGLNFSLLKDKKFGDLHIFLFSKR